MQLGLIGVGRMGANIARRLRRRGVEVSAYDRSVEALKSLSSDGIRGCSTLEELVTSLRPPRAVWIMVPASAVDAVVHEIAPLLVRDDILIDAGNSHYHEDIRRARELSENGIRYVDVGTSGGVWGLERGFCLMIGGDSEVVGRLDPIFAALAPGREAAPPTPGRGADAGTADQGYLHCGSHGAGHFVKMVHNGIEYGMMAAFSEGLNLLHHADVGRASREGDAETAPLEHPEHYGYVFDVPEICELWRRGSVIGSWLLDLTAQSLLEEPSLEPFAGRVADSGEGRWTLQAAIETGVPVPVLSAALYSRFASRGNARYANRVLSAMRHAFGGHRERSPEEDER